MKISIFILISIGIIFLSVSLLADLIGIGAFPGFGYKQVIGIAIGVVFIIIGLIMSRNNNKEDFKDRIFILLQQILKSKFNNDVFIAVALFTLSLIIRLFFYYSHLDLTNFLSIVGVPFCDARFWNEGAIAISQGKGISGPNRPFYSILLAIFYTWFGPSFFLAKILNIIANSLTVSFIYLMGKKVFNKLIGLAAAIIAMLNMDYLTNNLTIMTEPLGLFLFVLSCYLLILGLERKSYSLLLFAGVVFSLCNLTRTMTLIAFPGYLFIIFCILKKQNISYRKNILLLSLFSFGVLITLTPWLIRQKVIYGVLSIAPNSANLIYAATSPKYQQWNGAEVQEAVEKGLITLKEQYNYFLKGAMNNILQYPLFYLKNCLKSTYKFIACYKCQLSPIPQKVEFILCFVGIILSFILKSSYALILINSLVFVVIGSAMVANAGTPYRLFTMVSWIFDFFYIFTLAYIVCFVYFKFILKKDESYLKRLISNEEHIINRSFYDGGRLKKYLQYFSFLFLFFFIVSSMKIIYLNFSKTPSAEDIPSLNLQEKMKIVAEINRIRPGSFDHIGLNEDIFAEPKNQFINDPNDYKDHGKIVVYLSKIDKYLYYIPKEKKIHDWFRLFTHRDYDRTIFSMGNWGWVFYIFPGEIPNEWKGKYVIAVGKLSVDMNFMHESRRIVELIAIIPYEGSLDFKKMVLATNEEHWKILN
jgi:4-amino-4-deoxy-L-arabinose transferase-like glycosyltransferase